MRTAAGDWPVQKSLITSALQLQLDFGVHAVGQLAGQTIFKRRNGTTRVNRYKPCRSLSCPFRLNDAGQDRKRIASSASVSIGRLAVCSLLRVYHKLVA